MLTDTSSSDDVGGILDGTPSTNTEDKAPKKRKAPKSAPQKAKVYKLDTSKPTGKGNGKDSTAKKAKPVAEPALPKKKAKAEPAPAKKAKTEDVPKRAKPVQSDISTQQPEDSVVLKAVRKLKQPQLAAQFSLGLGVHRRVIRVQLQRLAKDKANGVGMKKQGANWWVSNNEK